MKTVRRVTLSASGGRRAGPPSGPLTALCAALLAAACSGATSGGTAASGGKPLASEAVGSGRVVTEAPPGAAIAIDARGKRAEPAVTSDFTGLPTSNRWWSSLIWKFEPEEQHSLALHAHPLVLRARAAGLGLGYPDKPVVTPRSYMHEFDEDLLVGLEGLQADATRVAAYSDWAVTADWQDRLRLTLGHGLPFVYGERRDASPVVVLVPQKKRDGAKVFHAEGAALGVTVGGHHYGLFAPLGASWQRTEEGFRLEGEGARFSVAVLTAGTREDLERFRRHAYAFVKGTQVEWSFDEKKSALTTRYSWETEFAATCGGQAESGECRGLSHEPLVALYRHQWLAATQRDFLAGEYGSARGTMKLLAAQSFSTETRVGGVLPILPPVEGHERKKISNYVRRVLDQPELFPLGLGEKPDHDAYWEGKSFGKLSNLVHLADQLGETEMRDELLGAIKARLEDWFDGAAPRFFHYEGTWKSLVGFPDSYGSATQLNDHHFHYGYFVFAAATIARFDPAWAQRYKGIVELLIRDAANERRGDTKFPFLRHMDPYAGHSWANGPSQFEQGNNEEASSEELNFSNAVVLWGELLGDDSLRDLGVFLVGQQVSAIEQYWFDVDQRVFPKDFKHPVVAMVWGAGGKYDTWFDQDPTAIHGINYLPFTGGSLYLGRRPETVTRNFSVLLERSHGDITSWRDYVLMYLATGDAELAYEHFERDRHFEPEFGNSMAYTLHWLQAWRELGRLDPQITADVVTHAVFVKEGKRRYVAFNPDDRPRRVTFSDGKSFEVAPRALGLE